MAATSPVGPEEHLDEVLRAFAGTPDPRLRELVGAVVRHLHAMVVETCLTREEWAAAIAFLTSVGRHCDETRQEFVLLSDTLGVSMLVEMLNQEVGKGCTEPTVLGPFYVADAPDRENGESIVSATEGDEGQPLLLLGQVRSSDGTPLIGATVEVWETQSDGRYDVQTPERRPNMRGVYRTDEQGRYRIRCLRPVDYTIPDDGPVGAMLRATARTPWRPAHIHLLVSAAGHQTLTTHLFDAESTHLHEDAVFGVRPSLVTDMTKGTTHFDIVLARANQQ